MWQPVAGLVAQAFGNVNVVGGNFVANTAGSRVQERPDTLGFVNTDLNEMGAPAERAKLDSPIPIKRVRVKAGLQSRGLEPIDARCSGRLHLTVVPAGRAGHRSIKSVPECG